MAKTDTTAAVRRITEDGGRTTPALLLAAMSAPQTEQQARLARLFRSTAAARRRGVKAVAVSLADLEALITIAALTDAGVMQ